MVFGKRMFSLMELITVREVLDGSRLQFSKKDISTIGTRCREVADAKGVLVQKVPEFWGGLKYDVNGYPASFQGDIQEVVLKYFSA